VPLLKVSGLLAQMGDQIPEEPTAPGRNRTQYGLHASAVCCWLSAWQVRGPPVVLAAPALPACGCCLVRGGCRARLPAGPLA
jgi:hypothetical protein